MSPTAEMKSPPAPLPPVTVTTPSAQPPEATVVHRSIPTSVANAKTMFLALEMPERLMVGGGAVGLVLSFLPWQSASISSRMVNGSSSFFGGWCAMLAIVALGSLLFSLFRTPGIPQLRARIKELRVACAATASVVTLLFMLASFLQSEDIRSAETLGRQLDDTFRVSVGPTFFCIASLLASATATCGALLRVRER